MSKFFYPRRFVIDYKVKHKPVHRLEIIHNYRMSEIRMDGELMFSDTPTLWQWLTSRRKHFELSIKQPPKKGTQ